MKKAWLAALLFGLLCTGCDTLDEAKKLKAQLEYAQKHIYALRGELNNAQEQIKRLNYELSDIKQKYAQAQAQLEENQRLYKQMLE